MHILSIGRAHPPHYYSQTYILSKLQELWGSDRREASKLQRFHEATTVEGRHVAMPLEEFHEIEHFGQSNDAYIRVGTEVAEQAISDALKQSGLNAEDVNAISFLQ